MKCKICRETKPPERFAWRNKKKGKRHTRCLDCFATYRRERYKQSGAVRKAAVARNRQNIRKKRRLVLDYLRSHPCVDCGEDDPVVLEFDHLRDKTDCVSQMVANNLGVKKIFEEIEKCEVRCANCHKRKTAKDFGWYHDDNLLPTG